VFANAQEAQLKIKIDSLERATVLLSSSLYQQNEDITTLKAQYGTLNSKIISLESKLQGVSQQNARQDSQINSTNLKQGALQSNVDSLYRCYNALINKQQQDNERLTAQIGETQKDVVANNNIITNRTLWGIACIVLLLVIIIMLFVLFRHRIKKDADSIDEVRKTQKSLEAAQIALQEESLKLDNKLVEVVEKQLNAVKIQTISATNPTEVDHSLALKIADEIVRIEANLSRMDSSIKGHKQLSKAVERIKNNFSANGYEIVDMLGKPYIQGMKAAVTFVTDDSLEPGIQIISKIIKPQVNYKQEMIQAAQIEVSQTE
jgi:chromosome segregation ATPase